MILYKEIQLFPTSFYLDVWVTEDLDGLYDALRDMYNLKDAEIQLNEAGVIKTGSETLFEGDLRIYMTLEGFSPTIMTHELIHVLWHLSEQSGVELNKDSQEWHACMMESIMEECLNQESYDIYD